MEKTLDKIIIEFLAEHTPSEILQLQAEVKAERDQDSDSRDLVIDQVRILEE